MRAFCAFRHISPKRKESSKNDDTHFNFQLLAKLAANAQAGPIYIVPSRRDSSILFCQHKRRFSLYLQHVNRLFGCSYLFARHADPEIGECGGRKSSVMNIQY